MLVMCSNTAVSSQVLQDTLEVYDAGTMEHWAEDPLRFSGSLCFAVCALLVGASFGAFLFALGLSFASYERDL